MRMGRLDKRYKIYEFEYIYMVFNIQEYQDSKNDKKNEEKTKDAEIKVKERKGK